MQFGIRQFTLVVCAVLFAPLMAAAQYKVTLPAGSFDDSGIARDSRIRLHKLIETIRGESPFAPADTVKLWNLRMPNGKRQPQPLRWKIPSGKYGLQLANGTRVIGRPAAGWSARFKTAFGAVAIPLPQISHIAPNGAGQFSAHLKNGDRVTGTFVSATLRFETQFGTLQVAASEIVRLLSSNQPPKVK